MAYARASHSFENILFPAPSTGGKELGGKFFSIAPLWWTELSNLDFLGCFVYVVWLPRFCFVPHMGLQKERVAPPFLFSFFSDVCGVGCSFTHDDVH